MEGRWAVWGCGWLMVSGQEESRVGEILTCGCCCCIVVNIFSVVSVFSC